jgi:UDP-glucose 4-epimerase
VRTLVTGGAGFIGSTLAGALVAEGHAVTVVDDLSRGRRGNVPEGARLEVVDITSEGLTDLVREERPEIVFHQAAQIDVRRSISEPLFDTRLNVVGTVNVMQACVEAGARRLVFASSGGAIYGDTDLLPTPEDYPAAPASLYGAAKQSGEIYGGVFSDLYGLEFVALRYANVYGPRQDPHGEAGVVAIFAERLLRGEQPVINGDGTQTRDYVYVDDVVRANLRAMDAEVVGAYNVATSRETDVNAIFQILASACSSTAAPRHAPAKAGEQRRSCLDIRRAAQHLGWSPAVSLEDGLRRTVDWFRASSRQSA